MKKQYEPLQLNAIKRIVEIKADKILIVKTLMFYHPYYSTLGTFIEHFSDQLIDNKEVGFLLKSFKTVTITFKEVNP